MKVLKTSAFTVSSRSLKRALSAGAAWGDNSAALSTIKSASTCRCLSLAPRAGLCTDSMLLQASAEHSAGARGSGTWGYKSPRSSGYAVRIAASVFAAARRTFQLTSSSSLYWSSLSLTDT